MRPEGRHCVYPFTCQGRGQSAAPPFFASLKPLHQFDPVAEGVRDVAPCVTVQGLSRHEFDTEIAKAGP